ncbi:Gfo/Idh/MocA family oxidoreductase [Chloroflexi bacterium TSY]|nr:Gfo/Idh/MocA family oxidoreductase [Chloroflexi bacterium TSY]
MTSQGRINVGIAGLGRSGWGIHANAFPHLPEHFQVVAVCDPDTERQKEAVERFDCLAYSDYADLVADKAVELMVIATPSHLHASDAVAAMQSGKHVIVEKPMASDLAGADEMIAVAKETGQILTVNQNRRYSADFVKVQEVIASGVLGRIVEVRINAGGFSRRWDWQTLKEYGGGALNNTGAHFIDMGMLLLDDPEPTVFCHMESTPVYAGDADSHVKVILKPKSGPLVEINITHVCAYPQQTWLVMGTQGSMVCQGKEARWKYFDPAEAPPLVLDTTPTVDRSYNREELPWKEESVELINDSAGEVQNLYRSIFASIREGAPLAVTPESVRHQIAVLEKCRELNPV